MTTTTQAHQPLCQTSSQGFKAGAAPSSSILSSYYSTQQSPSDPSAPLATATATCSPAHPVSKSTTNPIPARISFLKNKNKNHSANTPTPHSRHQQPRLRLHPYNLPQPVQQPLRRPPFPVPRRSMDNTPRTNAHPRLGSGAKAR